MPTTPNTQNYTVPGEPIADWKLFEPRIQDGAIVAFTDPSGRRFTLREGESLEQERNSAGGRDTYIVTATDRTLFDEWGPKLSADNEERLRASGELGVYFADLYTAAVEANPHLAEAMIIPSGGHQNSVLTKTGGYASHKGATTTGKYEVTINTDDGWAHYETLLHARRTSAEDSARKLGIDPTRFTAKQLAGFIFLHELGHIDDYMHNAPDLSTYQARRDRDMQSLPWPGWNPARMANYLESDEGKRFWAQHSGEWISAGLHSPADLLHLQETRYHALVTEDNPDQFAVGVLRGNPRLWQEQASA